MLGKKWKLLVVVGVLAWSVVTLFRVIPQTELDRLNHLASIGPADLQKEVMERLEKLPGWEKMNNFEHEDSVKRAFEEAQYANNIQLIGQFHLPALASVKGMEAYQNAAVITNFKLGLDLRGGSQLLLQALPSKL